jgi:hypothetical protein
MIKCFRWLSLTVFLLALGLAASGCSDGGDELPREAVTGTVTLDGQKLATGSINFVSGSPTGPTVGGGSAVTDGQFSIDLEHGLVPGRYNVAINARAQATQSGVSDTLPGLSKSKAEMQRDIIPKKYNSETKLRAEVKKGGPNDFTFDLQSK